MARVRDRRTVNRGWAVPLALAAVLSLSLRTAPADEGHFEVGYETAAAVLGIPAGYTVFYFCHDKRPYQGSERCPDDRRLILEAADKPILQRT